MFTFEFDENQTMIRQLAQRVAVDQCLPHAGSWSEQSHAPRGLFQTLGASGLLSMTLPESFGGLAMDHTSVALALEALAGADAGAALVVLHHNVRACRALEALGAQATQWLERVAEGEVLLSFGHLRGGAASWVVGAHQADAHVLLQTKPDHVVVRLFLDEDVEREDLDVMGLRSAGVGRVRPTAPAKLEGTIPTDEWAQSAPDVHLGLAAIGLGLGQASFHEGTQYAIERKQFGKRLADFQVTQFKLARMATDLEACRMLLMSAAQAGTHGSERHARLAQLAAQRALSCAMHTSDEALQLHGGYGYTEEYTVERLYRDARALSPLLQDMP